ncbi:hypothetical protein CMO96_05100 [Candidatus Woesebacteria bacterium]|nr:hypothetical protein [Candidatus Woesebacteria bacterium]|tara:strand:+ start:212 stop:544 length:333 start_codon:yes stop_codon:yes gene_type:complete
MKLSYSDRIKLSNILPPTGNVITIRILDDLRRNLSATEKEVKKYKIKLVPQPDGKSSISWNPEFEADIEIGDAAKDIIIKRLKEMSDKEELTIDLLPIYDLFFPKEKEKK